MQFAFQKGAYSYIVMDFEHGGDLHGILRRYQLTSSAVRFYTSQLLLALEHIHIQHIIHRDVKSENILLDKHGNIKLADFGLAKKLNENEKTNTLCGSDAYLAPEVIAGDFYSCSVDIWQFACLLYQLFVGRPLFFHYRVRQMRKLITQCSPVYPLGLPVEAKSLLQGIILSNPFRRLAYDWGHWERIKHASFFKDVDWGLVMERRTYAPISTELTQLNVFDNFEDEFLSMDCNFKGLLESSTNDFLVGFEYSSKYPKLIAHNQSPMECSKSNIPCY